MANFNFSNLYLINPCEINDECYRRAMHAQKIIDEAKIFNSFNDCVKKLDYLIATSSIESKSDKKHLRNAVLLENLSEKIYEIDGKVGIVFGREDYGLFNEEIASCDIMLKIPTSEKYPSMNLSHSVAVVLYSLFIYKKKESKKKRTIGKIEKEKLFVFFSDLLDEINYPIHKKENTKIMFKRMMGRAMPSKWEYHTFMGVLSGSLAKLKSKKRN
jgi:tRNA/rRNA methyltransferase